MLKCVEKIHTGVVRVFFFFIILVRLELELACMMVFFDKVLPFLI